MEITFDKTAQRRYEVIARRDDGVVIQVSSCDRPSRLPHDMAHYVVEKGLRLERGLWGLLAAGMICSNMRVIAGRKPPHSAERSRAVIKKAGQQTTEAEVLVSVMVEITEQGLENDLLAVSSRLNRMWKPRRSQRGLISFDEIGGVSRALREAEEQWQALPVGQSMTVSWAAQHNKRLNRTRNKRVS